MDPFTQLPLDDIKHLLKQIPSVTLLEDMTGPVIEVDGKSYPAVTRGVREDQINVIDFEKEFAGKTIALYQYTLCTGGRKAGELYHVFDPVTFEMSPEIAEVDEPAMYTLRYATITG